MIGTFVALIFYLTSQKIIKKIGTILILVAALLFTFSKSLPFFVLAEVLYEVSFVFLCVDTVVFSNNLVFQKKDDEFIKIKNKANMIYSVATLIALAVAGILFNINPYIPMIICILICLNNFIMHILFMK